ncbi:MAG: hypothetical protein Kow0063_03510 [Anaerolineae bacterium]
MAKKSRRARRQQTARPRGIPASAQSPQTPQSPTAVAEERPPVVASTTRKQVDFAAEYRYVIDDLRSMAIIAAAMLVVLLALSFVIG